MSLEFRILDENFAFDSTVSITASSSDSQFPTSNLQTYFRSKPWRSSGNFVVTTGSNDAIDFKDASGGGELNATIASGTYTTTTLATAVKAAMEAVTGDTITVSHSESTGKWTISTSGSFLSLLFSSGTNTANNAADLMGYAVSDHTGALTYTSADISIHSEEYLIFDNKTIEPIDSFAVLFDPEDDIGFTEEAVIKLQANPSVNFTSPAVDVTLSIDEGLRLITHFFTSDQSYRFWRISITDKSNPNLYVQVPMVFLSKGTQLSRGIDVGFTDTFIDQSRKFKTDFGHEYSDVFPIKQSFTWALTLLNNSDRNTLADIFLKKGNTIPICISLDSAAALFDKDRFFIYGTLQGDFAATNIIRDVFTQELSLEERF